MPVKSAKQLRWAYWTASGKNPETPAAVGEDFVRATPKANRQALMDAVKSHLSPKGKLRRGD